MRRSARYYLERRSADGRWTPAGAEEACVFASATAARRALASVVRGGAERAQLRILRREWSESFLRYFEEVVL